MSVEAILARIAAESEAEAAAALAAGEATARSLVEAARAASAARVATALERAEPVLQAEEARTVNAARLRLMERLAERSSRRTAAVFDAAGARLAAIALEDPGRSGASVRRLVGEGLELAGRGAVILVRPADAGSVEAIASAWDARIEPLEGDGVGPGAVVVSADGLLEVDATIAARLARARTRLAGPVAQLLGLEG